MLNRISWIAALYLGLVGCNSNGSSQPANPGMASSEFRLSFTEQGQLDAASAHTPDVIKKAAESATDVFVFSHGWWNDPRTAECRYRRMIEGIKQHAPADAKGMRAVLVGIYWPSAVFPLEKANCDVVAEVDEVQESLMVVRPSTFLGRWSREAFPAAAQRPDFAGELEELSTLLDKELTQQLTESEARRVIAILQIWRDAADPPNQVTPDVGENAFGGTSQEVAEAWRGTTEVGGFVTWLNFANAFTFWTMKERAGTVGSRGVFELLGQLQDFRKKGLRIHLIGHSFGGKLMAAAITGHGRTPLNRVDSLVILQGAFSHFAFATAAEISAMGIPGDKPGLYASIVSQSLVEGPIIVTHTRHDRPLRSLYPVGVRISRDYTEAQAAISKWGALGADGIQGPPTSTVVLDKEPLSSGSPRGRLVNVDASDVIRGHSDLEHREVYGILWRAAIGR